MHFKVPNLSQTADKQSYHVLLRLKTCTWQRFKEIAGVEACVTTIFISAEVLKPYF
jgi:hypothetical protein